jgi:N,N'-diacetyllegionaminate synthase
MSAMPMVADGVRVVALLPTSTPAAARAALAAAADAGVSTVLLALAGDGAPAARLPFELADFEPGPPPSAVALARRDLETLVADARSRGIGVVCSIGDGAALALARGVDAPALHLPASAVLDLSLVAAAADAGVPLWIDTAMTALDEVAETVATAVTRGARVLLLHGLATAAGRPEELNLRALVSLRERFGMPVGWQARDVTPAAVTAAAALGATVIVVPFDPAGHAGFDTAALAALHADAALVERALGDGDKRVQPSEWPERDRLQRSLVARVDIARGATLTAEMLDTARPGIGLKPRAATGVVGRRAAVDIAAGTLLTLGMLE